MRSFFRFIGYVLVVYVLLTSVISVFREALSEQAECKDQFQVNQMHNRWHQRDWELIDHSDRFCASYVSEASVSRAAGINRNELVINMDDYENFWGTIYDSLAQQGHNEIQFLIDSLSAVALEHRLSRSALAEMVVTFVQDIPYSYVRSRECSEFDNRGKPCVGGIALGLLSPYEFIHSLYGDCDTRAVLIYAMLFQLGFEPMIVVSNEYAHAMIALHLPAVGDHLTYKGKNYYFWETTGKGWPIGILPPNSNNINYWKIALVHES